VRELYVYYKVADARAAAAKLQVDALHAGLKLACPQLRTRLLHRRDEGAPTQTWMETYAVDPGAGTRGVDLALQAEIEARALALLGLIEGPRHVEAFETFEA
jgi:hypothetical protein